MAIEIKKSNEGKFTQYCKDKWNSGVTSKCIREGLASEMSKTRKMAQFAKNARSFDHNKKDK